MLTNASSLWLVCLQELAVEALLDNGFGGQSNCTNKSQLILLLGKNGVPLTIWLLLIVLQFYNLDWVYHWAPTAFLVLTSTHGPLKIKLKGKTISGTN